MRFRILSALLLSIVLIVGATWLRFDVNKPTEVPLISAENKPLPDTDTYVPTAEADLSNSENIPTEEVKTAGLVARQLVLDYVDLAANGRATTENLDALVDKYISKIPTLNTSVSIKSSDLKEVVDSPKNFQEYGDYMFKINEDFGSVMNKAYRNGNISDIGPGLSTFTQVVGQAYNNAATKLKNIPVPSSMASSHLELVNSYLSSAGAMDSISKTEKDSAIAFAGVITLNNNINNEAGILNEIFQTLNSHGIQF